MTTNELGQLLLAAGALLLLATVLGQVCVRLRQPKVVGEILAGVLLGPSVLGALAPDVAATVLGEDGGVVRVGLSFLHHLGLLLLMFVAGSSVRRVLGQENRRPTWVMLAVGTPLPFLLVLAASPLLPLDPLVGDAGSRAALVLVLCSAVAVTSIPVISRIFQDLGILRTRFASLILGKAVLEDIALWGVLSIATAIATATLEAEAGDLAGGIARNLVANVVFLTLAMTVMPRVLRHLGRASWNVVARNAPITWLLVVLLTYVWVATVVDVTPVFAAFLAGFALMGGTGRTEEDRLGAPMQQVGAVASAMFVPIYFALVGHRLDFGQRFSATMLVVFLVGSSVVAIATGMLSARIAGFRRLAAFNLAITENARGGPGIVMASVTFEAGIISSAFFTTLVITAVVTSQLCGTWLEHVLRRGWSLLGETPEQEAAWERDHHADDTTTPTTDRPSALPEVHHV